MRILRGQAMTGALMAAILATGLGSAQQVKREQHLPTILSASVPIYPADARLAHIEGVIRLRVSTNGKRVSAVRVESGQPILAQAARTNVSTWQFKRHSPTTFEVTFRYAILPNSECDPENDNGTVLMRLPSEVEVSAKAVILCDPGEIVP